MWLLSKYLLLHLLLTAAASASAATTSATSASDYISYSYSYFNRTNSNNFNFSADANEDQGALQVTPDTLNKIDYIMNKSGRIILTRPFRLWSPSAAGTDRRLASFNSTFSVNIFRPTNTSLPGEGLTFLIAPDASAPPPGSYGGFLGLTNSSIDGNSSNRLVAVELDTVKQDYDPDDNHIGLDINGVVSNVTASLTPFGIQISPSGYVNYTVWISYDGVNKSIMIYMAQRGQPRPGKPVLETELDLSLFVNQDSYLGFSGSTGSTDYELNCVLDWDLIVENLGDGNKKGGNVWKVAVGLAVGVAVVVATAAVLLYIWRKNKATVEPSALEGTLKSLPGMPREFEYKELRRATNGFDERTKLGQGGFGIVYKGIIAGDGAEVAVKRFSRGDNMNSQDDFLKELTVINRLRHKHLVRLLGWCHKKGVLLLVYDYMPNGSLDQHLYNGGGRPLLPWNLRVQVLAGVASAVHYLHNEYNECVVHRDIKSSNVMLDASFNARLGDFGLARVLETGKTSYAELDAAGVPGTIGYIAPECFHTGRATRESDVFAFGALVLEVVTGRRPRCTDLPEFHFLADWVWKLHRERILLEAVDERLSGEFEIEEAQRLLLLGLSCSHPLPGERPKAAAIVQILIGSADPPTVPPFKPAFMWPVTEPLGVGGELTTSTSTSSTLFYASSSLWSPLHVSK